MAGKIMNISDNVAILIPAYEPDAKLLEVVSSLQAVFKHIIIVDDGSRHAETIFCSLQNQVEKLISHRQNQGKGAALKSGFDYILRQPGLAGVVTVDADGQHQVADVVKVANELLAHPGGLVLGAREFDGKVPFRSRFGNACTRALFTLATRMRIRDTQTGLRGISSLLLERMLHLPGSRYEYEMAMLVDAKNYASNVWQVPIHTIYIDENASSHFRPLRDALLIYRSLFQFCASSILAFVIDNVVFAMVFGLAESQDVARKIGVLIALCAARLISGHFQYFYNSRVVFHGHGGRSYCQYWGTALCIAVTSYWATVWITGALAVHGLLVTLLKIFMEMILFVLSYHVQKAWVFANKKGQ